ncbi:collagen-like protein [Legionella sp. 16cNR16C]|uniref:collagen-like protein n=1 Tax=Legionella sp. 16cNR16C TaxID=2905656 RepID=UPI001E3E1E5B|nr:collagen-like protein [Legionella sp. 16cNR16C]MCE3046203.1 collagen-like protein [Legionella sp. 16cNR16C]
MKKLVITAFSCLCFNGANAGDTDIWQHIGMLQDQMVVVSNQIAALARQIASIPAGPQGPQGMPGAKGERGPAGHYQAGSGIRIEGDVISANTISHQIGERYQGGIVFWVDDTGQHGLIASMNDVKAIKQAP